MDLEEYSKHIYQANLSSSEKDAEDRSEELSWMDEENGLEESPAEECKWRNSDAVKAWLSWCRSHAHVKCVEYDVPGGILPKNYRGVLIDVKVGGKKRAPDDKIYLAHPELREKVARGNCVLELHEIEKGKIVRTRYTFLVFALKKFSGGMGDDDDSPCSMSDWKSYFIKPISDAKKVIATEKANGEAGHVSSQKMFGQTYFCMGSKNVHMLLRNEDDITKYTDGRFDFARRVAQTFFNTIIQNPEIAQEKKDAFICFLQKYEYTTVTEMVQPNHQHVVNLSHLEHPELKFICWTKADVEHKFTGKNTLCALPIHEAIEKARGFGMKTVEYDTITSNSDVLEAAEEYMQNIRREYGYEGKVLYFLDVDNCTVGLIKKKTAWYVILRALREKVAGFHSTKNSSSIAELCQKIGKRIKAIQSWLGFSDEYATKWIEICTGFAKWLHFKRLCKDVPIRSQFPIRFKEFLNDENNDKYKVLYENLQGTF